MENWSSNSNSVPWSSQRSSIKKVCISSGVTNIGGCAFYNCTSLTSVDISAGVTSIGNSAFRGCSSLTSIGSYAFYNCKALTLFDFPDSVVNTDSYAFRNCTNLLSVKFGKDSYITTIVANAFNGCSNLTIYGYNDSVPQQYATDNSLRFSLLEQVSYTISYHSDNSTNIPEAQTKAHGTNLVLTDKIPTRSGYTFVGWGVTENGFVKTYNPGDTYKLDNDVTLCALWITATPSAPGNVVYGDVNDDARVDVSDVIRILQFLASPSTQLGPTI